MTPRCRLGSSRKHRVRTARPQFFVACAARTLRICTHLAGQSSAFSRATSGIRKILITSDICSDYSMREGNRMSFCKDEQLMNIKFLIRPHLRCDVLRRPKVTFLRFTQLNVGENMVGAIRRGSFGLRRARVIALGEAATVFSGVAAAAMFSGTVCCHAANGGTNTSKPGYGNFDSAHGLSAVSAIRILSQKPELSLGELMMTPKYSPAHTNLPGDVALPGAGMGIKNAQITGRSQEDSGLFQFIKDGLRAMTGFVRSNRLEYPLGSSEATIGVRGSAGEEWECTDGRQCTRHATSHSLMPSTRYDG